MATIEINVKDLLERFRSKHDLFIYLTKECKLLYRCPRLSTGYIVQWVLPAKKYCSYRHMVQILTDKKKVFLESECPPISMRRFNELKAANILKKVLPHSVIESYLPDKTSKLYRCD